MPIVRFALSLLLVSSIAAPATGEVLVRWDLDQVPSRDSLGVSSIVVPASKAALAQEAIARGYRVYLDVDAASLAALGAVPDAAGGVVVRGEASRRQLDALRLRMRAPARVLHVDGRGAWPHVRLNWVTLRNNVLQVSSRTAQPWLESNAVFSRIGRAGGSAGEGPVLLSYDWQPITAAETHLGPALENYLVAIAEAGGFGHDLLLPLHEGFQRDLLLGKPAARATWQEMRRYLEFYGWDLPRRYRRLSNVGVLVANPGDAVEVLRLLSRHNLPFEVVSPDALQRGDLRSFGLIVALDPLQGGQAAALSAFARAGGTVVLNGPAQATAWEGALAAGENERQVTYGLGSGRIVARREAIADPDEFARDVRDMLGPEGRLVDVWNGITVMLAPYEDERGETLLLNVLNYAHSAQPIQLRVKGLFSEGYFESPEAGPELLPLRHRDGFTEFVVPSLRVGGRVFLSRER